MNKPAVDRHLISIGHLSRITRQVISPLGHLGPWDAIPRPLPSPPVPLRANRLGRPGRFRLHPSPASGARDGSYQRKIGQTPKIVG